MDTCKTYTREEATTGLCLIQLGLKNGCPNSGPQPLVHSLILQSDLGRSTACSGPGVAYWVRRCATSRTVPGSIPGSVTGFFSDIFPPYHGPEVDSAPSENEYQEHFLRVKAAGA